MFSRDLVDLDGAYAMCERFADEMLVGINPADSAAGGLAEVSA